MRPEDPTPQERWQPSMVHRVGHTPLLDDKGDYAGGIAMITDITERKHAEEALKEAKAQGELIPRSDGQPY